MKTFKKLTFLKSKISRLLKSIKYENVLDKIMIHSFAGPFCISFAGCIMVSLANYSGEYKLPLFPLFLSLFYVILALSYYSLKMNEQSNKTFHTESMSDDTIFRKREKYTFQRKSDLNYFFHIISLYVLLLPRTYKAPIEVITLTSCFTALFIIVNISIIGYTQYIHFIRFIHELSKTKDIIAIYEPDSIANTKWLVTLAKTAQRYNIMFLIVGLCYLILFFTYCQSGLYIYFDPLTKKIIGFAWTILIIAIVFVFPLTTVFVMLDIKKIVCKLKTQRLAILTNRRDNINDETMRNSYSSVIMLTVNAPEYPIKILFSSIVSAFIEIINIASTICSLGPLITLFRSIV